MSVLTALQSASVRLIKRRPPAFFSSQGKFEMELADLANEVAVDIMQSHDWRALTVKQIMTGDGEATSFILPEDYDRMVLGQSVNRPGWSGWEYSGVLSLDDWERLLAFGPKTDPGSWIILGGAMQFCPAIPDQQIATFYYISSNVVRSSGGTPGKVFTMDTDRFVLDERLLTLGVTWRWRQQQRMDFSAEQDAYIKALSEIAGRDKGTRVIRERASAITANDVFGWLGRR